MNTRKIVATLIVLLTILSIKAEQVAPGRIDKFLAIINNTNLSSSRVRDSIISFPDFSNSPITISEYEVLRSAINKRITSSTPLEELFAYCQFQVDCLRSSNNIGKELVIANKFLHMARQANDQKMLVKAYDLMGRVYSHYGMDEDWLNYARKSYYLTCIIDPSNKVVNSGGLSWTLTQVGWATKNKALMDSAAILLKERLEDGLKKDVPGNQIVEIYTVLLMTLARTKQYDESILFSRKGIRYIQQHPYPDKKLQVHSLSIFFGRMGMAYCGLKNRDSTFYYLTKTERFFDTKTPRNTYYPPLKKYIEMPELLDLAGAHGKFEEYKEASDLLYMAIFSKDKITDPYNRINLLNWAPPLFEKAGRKDEAIYCYAHSKRNNDSLNVEEDKLRKEAELTTTRLQIEAAEEASKLENEKITLEAQKESEQKKFILITSSVVALFLLLFAAFSYNRFRASRKQNNIITQQKHLLEEKNKDITDSIKYARRIQSAHLPSEKLLGKTIERLKKQ